MCLALTHLPIHKEGHLVVQKVTKRFNKTTPCHRGGKYFPSELVTPYQGTRLPKDGVLVAKGKRDIDRWIDIYSVRDKVYGGYIHSYAVNLGILGHLCESIAIGVHGWGSNDDVISDILVVPSISKRDEWRELASTLVINKPVYIEIPWLLSVLPKKAHGKLTDLYEIS